MRIIGLTNPRKKPSLESMHCFLGSAGLVLQTQVDSHPYLRDNQAHDSRGKQVAMSVGFSYVKIKGESGELRGKI